MFRQQGVAYYSLPSVLPEARVLAIHPAMGIVIRLHKGAAEPIEAVIQLTMKEMDMLLVLLHTHPACCSYGMLLTGFFSGSASEELVSRSERWLAEAAGIQAWEQQMQPVKHVLSRLRLGLQALDMDIAAVPGTGYVLLEGGKG